MVTYSAATDKIALLYADRLGEVWATDLHTMTQRVMLGGHTASMITDLAISPCARLLATADRDEKIRLSLLPALSIEAYCLGHTDVVTSVAFIPDSQLLCSVGWDFSLCLWDYSGRLMHQLSFRGAGAPTVDKDSGVTGDAGAEEEEEGEAERVYDEKQAGSFPRRVVASSSLAAVLFRGESELRLVPLAGAQLGSPLVVPLAAVPVDILFVAPGLLAVLLPAPHCLEFFECAAVSGVASCRPCAREHWTHLARTLAEYCAAQGVSFEECSAFSDMGADGLAEGSGAMRKHVLDTPYEEARLQKQQKNKRRRPAEAAPAE